MIPLLKVLKVFTLTLCCILLHDVTTNYRRVQGTTAKLMTEKALKYYPCSINFSGNLAAKSSYLVCEMQFLLR